MNDVNQWKENFNSSENYKMMKALKFGVDLKNHFKVQLKFKSLKLGSILQGKAQRRFGPLNIHY